MNELENLKQANGRLLNCLSLAYWHLKRLADLPQTSVEPGTQRSALLHDMSLIRNAIAEFSQDGKY